MNVSFRLAKSDDLGLLLKLTQEYYALDRHPYDEKKIRLAIEGLASDSERGAVWLIEAQGATIGYLVLSLSYSLEYGGIDAFLDEIYLREAFRGKGIGKRAIAFLEAECANRKVKALHLEVERKNRNAQKFYRNLGFLDNDRQLLTKKLNPE